MVLTGYCGWLSTLTCAWGGYEVACDSGPSYFFVLAAAGIAAIGSWYLTRQGECALLRG